jgi:LytS/YehU family sensor histidine kinase
MAGKFSSKSLAFVALMAALGNVLSFLSMQLAPIAPSIPVGQGSVSLAFDLSHLTTFVAAIFGGPIVGGFTGLIGGFVAAFEFGFSKGNVITGIGLPIGKALTGVTAGLLFSRIDIVSRKYAPIIGTALSYIPEAIFTVFLFVYVLPPFLGMPVFVAQAVVTQIIVKAYVEMVVMGLILVGFMSNAGFVASCRAMFPGGRSLGDEAQKPESSG